VTWVDLDGSEHVFHEPGIVLEALRRITDAIPTGGKVQSISTPHSIYNDLTKMPRRHGGRGRYRSLDPFGFERTLLGMVGRLDLLPEQARRKL
jgi:hypothetical protein